MGGVGLGVPESSNFASRRQAGPPRAAEGRRGPPRAAEGRRGPPLVPRRFGDPHPEHPSGEDRQGCRNGQQDQANRKIRRHINTLRYRRHDRRPHTVSHHSVRPVNSLLTQCAVRAMRAARGAGNLPSVTTWESGRCLTRQQITMTQRAHQAAIRGGLWGADRPTDPPSGWRLVLCALRHARPVASSGLIPLRQSGRGAGAGIVGGASPHPTLSAIRRAPCGRGCRPAAEACPMPRLSESSRCWRRALPRQRSCCMRGGCTRPSESGWRPRLRRRFRSDPCARPSVTDGAASRVWRARKQA